MKILGTNICWYWTRIVGVNWTCNRRHSVETETVRQRQTNRETEREREREREEERKQTLNQKELSVHTDTLSVLLLISVVTDALIAAPRVEALLRACVMTYVDRWIFLIHNM